ncbi:TonB-dependent receptor [Neiella sp. HB171785]|uniref:TonB-dependent receptor n=1 Tax=Neiella litorisoli TaxID=2771431 RepID=A0A8J6QFV2_9GAMM|nr:TonB-dependent receptor [Neiella litorisoli]MBD1389034.1 TonB-dependent receptor [Neiella litorisoli]
MLKRTLIANAVVAALACSVPTLYAAENDQTEAAADETEVIQVTGIRGSLSKAINIKRESYQLVDAIVAEDIGKFPDNNVVEALQRVSGVQVTDRGAGEVNTVTIRGLTDVTTTVNGRQIFTASGRSVALADMPAALLETVEVYKTRSASQVGSGIAGQIDISTQRPFNFEGSKVVFAGRAIYQDQADEVDPNLSLLLSNRWETSHGDFGALVNVSYAETSYRDQGVAPGAFVPFMTMNPADGFGQLERIFPTDPRVTESPIWEPGLEQGLPWNAGATLDINGVPTEYYLSRDAVFANDFTGERERPAANISLQWAPNDSSEYVFEAFYNGYRNESFNSLMFTFVDWWGGVDDSNPPILYKDTNIIKERYVSSPYGFNSGDLTKESTDSYVFALGGKWDLTDDFFLSSDLYYQDSTFESDFIAMRTDRVAHGLYVDFNDKNGLPALEFFDNPDTDVNEADLTDPSLWNVAQLYDNGGKRKGDAVTLHLDAEYFAEWNGIERIAFGGMYDVRNSSEYTRGVDGFLGQPLSDLDEGLVHITKGFYDGKADIPTAWAVADGHYIHKHRDQFRELYGFPEDQLVLEQTFDIEETTTSLYFEMDYVNELFGREFDAQIGLRYEHVDRDMDFFNVDADPITKSSASNSNESWLPSLVMRYHLTDDIIARFAYTETIRQPDFVQLNAYIDYQEDVTNIGYGQAFGGNPDLAPVESKNYDISLEYYFNEGSSVYATWFKRDIEGFVYDSLRVVDYQAPGEDEPYPYILSQPDNASDGTLKGWELGAIYIPEGLPDMLEGIGAQASATILDSEQDLPVYDEEGELKGYNTRDMFGVSDKSYSTVLFMEKEKFDMRLSYVWRDDFLANYEAALFANPRGVYRRPEESMDFQFSYFVNDDLTVTFDATNITEEIYKSYYEYPKTHNLGNSLYSRTFAVGIRYSI